VALFAGLFALALTRHDAALLDPAFAFATAAGCLVGYLLADLVAGTVHWIADRHFDPATPCLGPLLIEPFRAHHDDPRSITRHDFFEVLGNNALVAIPAASLLAWLPPAASAAACFAVTAALAATLAAVATNLFHAWAHTERPPRLVRGLQAAGLILTPARHARHHRGPHDRAYCVTSGWLNPLLDRAGVFARLDALIERAARRARATQAGREALRR